MFDNDFLIFAVNCELANLKTFWSSPGRNFQGYFPFIMVQNLNIVLIIYIFLYFLGWFISLVRFCLFAPKNLWNQSNSHICVGVRKHFTRLMNQPDICILPESFSLHLATFYEPRDITVYTFCSEDFAQDWLFLNRFSPIYADWHAYTPTGLQHSPEIVWPLKMFFPIVLYLRNLWYVRSDDTGELSVWHVWWVLTTNYWIKKYSRCIYFHYYCII